MTLSEYIRLITTEHADKPKFIATVSASYEPLAKVQEVLKDLPRAFDIDEATGEQLDAVGAWIGRSRRLDVPIEGVYFTWDDITADGWDGGVWKGEYDPDEGLVDLPDDAYRRVLKAKIAANNWQGTIPEAYEVWRTAFGGESILVIQDNQDMSVVIGIAGTPLGTLDKALLQSGQASLKSEGVRVNYYAIIPDEGQIFGWDVDTTEALAGWDVGQWSEQLIPT